MEISFLIPTPICLHTAIPYIKELQHRNVAIHFIVGQKVRDVADDLLLNASSVIGIDELARKTSFVMLLHSFLRIVFTKEDYSPNYQRWLSQRFSQKNRLAIVLLKLLITFGPKWSASEINQKLTSWISRILPNPFPTSRLIYITTTSKPHLHCASGLNVYTIMESWDHPGKAPFAHSSEKVFVWNESLKKDWQEYQGDNNILFSYPIKLGYAITANNLQKGQLLKPCHNRIMYPATFGSTSDQGMFAEELKLIETLCKVTQESGQKLLIKPKPNSRQGELDKFLEFSHVEIGQYQNNKGGSNYDLSDEYNENRLKELKKSDIVINLGTTFALDAAAFGLPVVQLKMACHQQYPYLSTLTTFPHLARHFYNKPECIFTITDSSPVTQELVFLCETSRYIQSAEAFSLYLREWIMPDCSLEHSVTSVIDACLG